MIFNNSLGSIVSLLTIDTTVATPHNSATNTLSITGTGGIIIPKGSIGQRPEHVSGLLRYNTDSTAVEFSDGTSWNTLAKFNDVESVVTASYITGLLDTHGDGGVPYYVKQSDFSTSVTDLVDSTYIAGLVDTRYVNVSGDSMTGDLTLYGNPTSALHAATKSYVDSIAQGIAIKPAVLAGTTDDLATTTGKTVVYENGTLGVGATLTIGADGEGLGLASLELDGVTFTATLQGVLVKDQTNTFENGRYYVSTVGDADTAWVLTRCGYCDEPHEIPSMFIFVQSGTTLQGTGWAALVDDPEDFDVGVDGINFTQFSGAGSYVAGAGLDLSGDIFSLEIPVTMTHGGTGLTSVGTSNQLLGMTSDALGLEYKTVSNGTGITVSHGANSITITNAGVLSLAGDNGSNTGLTLSASSSTGDITLSLGGTLSIAHGGTGQTTANEALNALVPPQTGNTGKFLKTDGVNTDWATAVTSVNVAGGTTGLTFTGGPITTTGTITMAGTLAATNGGTGLTAYGAANQVLGMNAGGTALEYKTVTAGTAISVVQGANAITINNTGVTSLIEGTGISLSGSTGDITVSSTGVTSLTVSTVGTGDENVSSGLKLGTTTSTTEGFDVPATANVTTTGTVYVELADSLVSLVNLTPSGVVVESGGTYVSRTLTGSAGNIVITNGDGIAGDPTINLAEVTQGTSNTSLVAIAIDSYGRISDNVAVGASEITTALGYTPINKAGDTVDGTLTFTSGTVTGLAAPTLGSDAATKSYVDAQVQGLNPKQVVQAATTEAGTLASSFANGSIIDGITLSTGDRILIKDQATASENGIYTVNASGAPTRAVDMDSWAEVPNAYVFISVGTTQADTGWVCTSNAGGTLGSTAINWVQFTGAGSYSAGAGLTLSGTEFSITAPIPTSLGGTGLTTLGSQYQFLAMNGAGSALIYNHLTGTNITIDHTVDGTFELINTGVVATSGGTTGLTLTTSGALGKTATLGGTLAIANGGTGQTTANGAFNALAPAQTGNSGTFLTTNGTDTSWATAVTSITGDDGSATGLSLTIGGTGSVPTITTGGTLSVDNGGTGLSGIGSANYILGVNAAANGLEYKQITGTGITINHTAGGIELVASSGTVTSVGLSAPSIFTVTNSPVTDSGTLTFSLNTQVANTVFAGPTSGGDAVPTFRALVLDDLPLELYAENPSTPTGNTVTGTNAVAIGNGASATAADTIAFGKDSKANIAGGVAFASGKFTNAGDAQSGLYTLRNVTTDDTQTELYLDGSTVQLVLSNNTLMTYSVTIAGFNASDQGAYRVDGGIMRGVNAASTTVIGSNKFILAETTNAQPWDVDVIADTTNGALKVVVTGAAATTINWVATILTTEVTA